ncbi:MAG: glycerol-3-phosphate acyltransferase, partial [Candidatus Aminicenantes bacterium]|nr:glycerol-3-phosphate acyltransferase [Candidatus Aminicenantes bacterium]
GHNWSVFLRFKGGGGLATSIGILIMFYPVYMLISVAAGFMFRLFVPMELAVFLGGSIYIVIVIFLEKNLWIGLLPLFLGIPLTIKQICWKKNRLKKNSLQN